jgi:hypothetical protein
MLAASLENTTRRPRPALLCAASARQTGELTASSDLHSALVCAALRLRAVTNHTDSTCARPVPAKTTTRRPRPALLCAASARQTGELTARSDLHSALVCAALRLIAVINHTDPACARRTTRRTAPIFSALRLLASSSFANDAKREPVRHPPRTSVRVVIAD